jgi:hypothetical protein
VVSSIRLFAEAVLYSNQAVAVFSSVLVAVVLWYLLVEFLKSL